ncbi:MAG TPA: hypothetical protein VMC80_01890 [Patescibacteria group bacterium]|nr:hypothetical protein [Patescibacteria group bacterium]
MSFQPTAEGRAGNINAALDIQVSKVKKALDEGSREKILLAYRDYAVTEGILKEGSPIGRLLANNARQGMYAYMRKKGFDIDSLVP